MSGLFVYFVNEPPNGGPLSGITPALKESCKKNHIIFARISFFIAEIKSVW